MESLYGGESNLLGESQIDISNRNISQIDPQTFNGLIKLKYLFIDHNRLTNLHEDLFVSLSSLISLRLDYNQLTSLSSSMFRSLVNLNGLWLNNNYIEAIDPNAFTPIINSSNNSVLIVFMSSNPIIVNNYSYVYNLCNYVITQKCYLNVTM